MKKFNKIIVTALVVLSTLAVIGLTRLVAVRAATATLVPLGSILTNNFVILAETGITNAGHGSTIIGNVGNSPGTAAQMKDVYCSEITGTIYGVDANAAYVGSGDTSCFAGNPGVPAVTPSDANKTLVDNAKNDMVTAYGLAAGQGPGTGDFLNVGAGTLNGQTFVPGVYTWNTPVTITGDITLLGGATDVWVFQTSGTLDIQVGNKIILSGGAQAKNIFWQVAGYTELFAGSTFEGNILDQTLIAMDEGAILHGRALAQTEVTLIGNTISGPTALHLRKTVTNDNGGTATSTGWTLTAIGTGGSATNLSGTTPVDSDSTFKVDTYTLAESGPAGYASSTYDCAKNGGTAVASNTIIMAAGDDAICTITNNDIAPALHLRKTVINDNGGTALNTAWTLTAIGTGGSSTNLSGTTPVNSGSTFKADTYTLAESDGPSGYDSSTYSCVKNGVTTVSNTITLAVGDDATCTITNNDIQTSTPAPSGGGGSSPVVQRILPIISITKLPSPLTLPSGPGLITYTYTVLNPGTVALRDIKVTDDKCSNVIFVSGDSNNDSWLDTNETWKFTCASQLTQTTKNIATVVGYDAGGMSATDVTNATVVVGQPVINYTPVIIATSSPVATPTPIIPKLPNTGLSEINSSWLIIALISVLSSLSLLYVIGKKHSD